MITQRQMLAIIKSNAPYVITEVGWHDEVTLESGEVFKVRHSEYIATLQQANAANINKAKIASDVFRRDCFHELIY